MPEELTMTCDRADRNARWWLLYALSLLLVGLFGAVEVFVPTGGLRGILQVVVMTGFGLMALWVKCNRVAMELEQTRRRQHSAKPASG